MQRFNYHTHTYRCGHTERDLRDEDYVEELVKNGFKKMAFTDHAPQKELIDTRLYMRMPYSQLQEYMGAIATLKGKYKGIIEIRSGFEIEYLPGQEGNLLELKEIADVLVLGQHFVYKDNRRDLKIYRNDIFNDDDLEKYACYISKACELGIPNIIAHPDLFMLSSSSFGDGEERATRIICEASAKSGIPLEINLGEVSSYEHPESARLHYPCKRFWEIASEYGVNVVYGIDAHSRAQISRYESSVRFVNELIGENVLKRLNFLSDI